MRSATSRNRSRFGPGERAVLGDVGDDVARAAVALKAFEHLPQVAAVGVPAAAAQPVLPVDDLTSRPTAIRSPCSAIARAHHAGSPSQRCRGSPARSRWRAPHSGSRRRGCRRTVRPPRRVRRPLRQAVRGWIRDRRRRRGRPDGPSPHRPAARPARRPARSRSSVSLPASPCTRRTAWPLATSTAGSRTNVAALATCQSPSTQFAAAPRRRRQTSRDGIAWPPAARSRRRRGTARRVSPRSAAAAGSTLPLLGGVGVHEVEAGVGVEALEQRRCPAGASTVFQPICGMTGACRRSTDPGHWPHPATRLRTRLRGRTGSACRRRCRAPDDRRRPGRR